ncbi:GNAT family N-acetyltransferase [Clostridium estertheticum]|uniref:GNAT family N-acetyltransferase n=1 Tax=Clostridium estertheticum TaxID=238834 RepID=UPI001C0B7726|nr:GNAT family N-acetyltransferase [Clostridium estertheticum]MBU3072956.1 GNAT family N-acetyltransferase [Clostridium estertheticum]MBU3163007.1 GNAT family N-acetyltransferase [Clostridium estertheticum]MBU3183743.1 GNAT family N-acetyltransferase [Clostridium estertheticum]
METKIVKGSIDYINDCEDTLVNSEIGIRYFSKKGSARTALEEGFAKEEIYIAMDINQNYKGFIWIILDGIFHSFPYLHIVAVKQESRNQGIGKNLLKFFENSCLKDYSKIFLVVADFNPDAERLYKKNGYIQVGTIPSLYMEGITEHLMMKSREENR